ncbi:hypothetical protein EN745_31770, partial [Mesorhizobium sp. M4A.F.Ca.ET.022.05.2.1]
DEAAAELPAPDAALAEMANKPVDDEVTEWATGVLDDKIDQVAAKLAEQDAAAATTDDTTSDPAEEETETTE